jgi:hypothetical protein
MSLMPKLFSHKKEAGNQLAFKMNQIIRAVCIQKINNNKFLKHISSRKIKQARSKLAPRVL